MNFLITLAHGSIEGVGDLWNGLLHPLRSPAQILVLVGLGLFAGQRKRFKQPVLVFLFAAALGLACTRIPGVPEPRASLPCLLSALTGVLVVLRRPLPSVAENLLFAACGFVLGWDSAPDETSAWVVFKILVGVWAGLAVLLLNLANYAAMVPGKQWLKIAFRVLGSWITAISALYLALSLKR